MTMWRVRDFHADDLDAAVRLWDNPEASCPACIGVSLLAGRVPGLAGLAAPDPVRSEPGDEPKVLVS